MTLTAPARRTRNKRGQGVQLRDEIITAAGAVLEQTGRDDAVTLRSIARAVGITAPAIYQHFADRDEILFALVTRTFEQLTAELRPAAAVHADPVARLRAVCHAYVSFAAEHTSLYRVLFERHHTSHTNAANRPADAPLDVDAMVGADAFGVLLEAMTACVDSGDSSASSPTHAATQLWVGLHGLSTLRPSMPYFPWPPLEGQLDDLIDQLAELAAPGRRG